MLNHEISHAKCHPMSPDKQLLIDFINQDFVKLQPL